MSDNYYDCPDLSDELNCRHEETIEFTCRLDLFTCVDGTCISKNLLCGKLLKIVDLQVCISDFNFDTNLELDDIIDRRIICQIQLLFCCDSAIYGNQN